SPALSYQIGQYFKANDLKNQADGGQRPGESSPAHLLAHSILGAAVAASGGHNALTGTLSAGGAEAAAPILSRWLYGKAASDLTAEEKQTVAGISGLLGAGIGAATGNSSADTVSGSLSARNAVGNNWLTAPEVDRLIHLEKACNGGAGLEQACLERDRLKALDTARDIRLLKACENPQSAECQNLKHQAILAMGRLKVGYAGQIGMSPEAKDAHNQEYSSTDVAVQLAGGSTPEQIAANTKLSQSVHRFLADLTVVGTIRDFREADTVSEYALAAIFSIPGLRPLEKLQYAEDFKRTYQAAKDAGDLDAAKELLTLTQEVQRSPNRLTQLAAAESRIHRIKEAQERLRDKVTSIEKILNYEGREAGGKNALVEALERFANTGQKVGEFRPSDHIQKAREQLNSIRNAERAIRNSTMPDKQALLDRLRNMRESLEPALKRAVEKQRSLTDK
ncbi:VENN motif pre-toxin domain-containing protein, partial [Neisseria shayeganii]